MGAILRVEELGMCPGARRAVATASTGKAQSGTGAPSEAPPRPNAWEWHCNVCTFINRPAFHSCEMCGLPRGAPSVEEAPPDRPGAWNEAARNHEAAEHQSSASAPQEAASGSGQPRSARGKGASQKKPGNRMSAANRSSVHQKPSAPEGAEGQENAGREILALLNPGRLQQHEAASAGREIMAALRCNQQKHDRNPSEDLLGALRSGAGGQQKEIEQLAHQHGGDEEYAHRGDAGRTRRRKGADRRR